MFCCKNTRFPAALHFIVNLINFMFFIYLYHHQLIVSLTGVGDTHRDHFVLMYSHVCRLLWTLMQDSEKGS